MIEHCKFMIIVIIPYYIDAFIISMLISILTGVSILTVISILTVVSSFSDRHHSPHFNFHVIFIGAYSAVRVKILCKHVWQK